VLKPSFEEDKKKGDASYSFRVKKKICTQAKQNA
jgi:hypothetical protein